MATLQLNAVVQHLRRVCLLRDGAGLTDGKLLGFFIADKDEDAFEALVRRHGPMVLKVGRRILGNHHDAEDVFQATFLLLARKASSIKPRDMVANWLHGVAYRTALKARNARAKKQARERQVYPLPEHYASSQDHSHDLHLLIDQELSRLGDIYRLPILLCDLEGKSIKETTRQLGWPQGTVAGRLARGRKLLAKRLARHGLATAGGVALLPQSVSACVPPGLVAATVKAAAAYAAGSSAGVGLISANVAILMEGAVKAMFFTKFKTFAAVMLVATIGVGGSVLSQPSLKATTGPGTGKSVLVPGEGKAGENAAAKVGQIVFVGADHFSHALIRQEILRMFPGEVIDYNALRTTEKKLSEVSPDFKVTIKVLGNKDKEFRDILVQVDKKDTSTRKPVPNENSEGKAGPNPTDPATRFGDVLKELELEKPIVTNLLPKAPAIYSFNFHKIEVGETGEKRNFMGAGAARVGDKYYQGPVGVMSGRDHIPLDGIACTAGITKLKDGRLRLDLQLEKYEKSGEEKDELRVKSISLRTIKVIKLGEKMLFDLEGSEKKGPRTRIELTVLGITPPPLMIPQLRKDASKTDQEEKTPD